MRNLFNRLFNRVRPQRRYNVIYSVPPNTFFLGVYVYAASAYEAQRKFDTDPQWFHARRQGIVER